MAAVEELATEWERRAPIGAFGFLGTLVFGGLVIGETSPSSEASAEEIASYFAEHQARCFSTAPWS